MNKYNAVKTKVNGYTFDSKREARRYDELVLLERANEINSLEVHPVFNLCVDGYLICRYEADFMYYDREFKRIVEDVKGVKTDVYKLKKKLMKAIYGIDILETS